MKKGDFVMMHRGKARVISVSDFGALVQPITIQKHTVKAKFKKIKGVKIMLDKPIERTFTSKGKPFYISASTPILKHTR